MSLTVLLPTLGERPETLARAIASVTSQTVDCDLIVKYDRDPIGAGPMLNRMLPAVNTTWVHTLGDDDTLEPHFAELLAAQPQDADLIIFQMINDAKSRVLPDTTDISKLHLGAVGCSYAVKTEMARKVGGWIKEPCTPDLAEDWEMIRTVMGVGVVRIVPEVVYKIKH